MKASKPPKQPLTLEEAWDTLAHLEAPELPDGLEDRFWLRLEQEEALSASPISSATVEPVQSPWAAFWNSFRWPALAGVAALSVLAGVFWLAPGKKGTSPVIVKKDKQKDQTPQVVKKKPDTRHPHAPNSIAVAIHGHGHGKKIDGNDVKKVARQLEVVRNMELYKKFAMFQKLAMFQKMEMFENFNDIEKAPVSKKKGS